MQCLRMVENSSLFLGQTTYDEWKQTINKYPAPWGELELPNKIIFTVQFSILRQFDIPKTIFRGMV